METKVLVFSVFHYQRFELDKMSDEEKYDLAWVSSSFADDESCVYSLKEFENKLNDEDINLNNVWVYFVTR